MMQHDTTCLQNCIARYQDTIPELTALSGLLQSDSLETLIDVYERCYPILQNALWTTPSDFDALLDCYRSLFREQEDLLQQRTPDERYHFILSIPVADRPTHLQTCLESILQLCQFYGYGGSKSGVYSRIKIIVAEDSREQQNIQRHIELIEQYRQKGLQLFHFGQQEQYELLQGLPAQQRDQLRRLLTSQPKHRFFLKGQAANRNLSYLKCLQLTQEKHKTLYYMVDSDQSFCVNRQTEAGEQVVFALNYFHAIDKIFRSTDTLMLTGKVVGDPPVSPAVMASNFLDDVIAFFTHLATTQDSGACQFHALPTQQPGDAAYHDMAALFGFDNRVSAFPYRCQLDGEHDHAACLTDFAIQLRAFFFGKHPTRKTFFSYKYDFTELTPARTVYPGNYIVNYEGLKFVIPFGHLRLRMSGPTAGRLIAAEIKKRFASANLPHLHRRTNEASISGNFRPGVDLQQQRIDISDEFERQFFGDLMLFSTEDLVARADVKQAFERDLVAAVIDQKEKDLLELYRQKHIDILQKNRQLSELVFNNENWWMRNPALSDALQQVRAFIENIGHNFGEHAQAWQQIQSAAHRAQRKQQIIEALVHYRQDREAWARLFP